MPDSLTIAFWNVRNLFEVGVNSRAPASPAERKAKLDALAGVIGRVRGNGLLPDVLVLAEVATTQLVLDLVGRFPGISLPSSIVLERAHDPTQHTGIAVVGLTSKVAQLLRIDADWGITGKNAVRPRALAVDVVVGGRVPLVSRDRFRLVACHWKSDLWSGVVPPATDRAASGRWLDAHVDNLDRLVPVVAVGDMNAEPFTPEIAGRRGLNSCRHYSVVEKGRRLFNTSWTSLAEPDDFVRTRSANYVVSRPRTSFSEKHVILDQLFVSRAALSGADYRVDERSIRYHVDPQNAHWTNGKRNVKPPGWEWTPGGTGVGDSDHFPLVFDVLY